MLAEIEKKLPKNAKYFSDGSFANVYTSGNRIIKVFNKTSDPAYWKYLQHIKNLDNPYVPKIYRIKILDTNDVLVVMEKLNSFYRMARCLQFDLLINQLECTKDELGDMYGFDMWDFSENILRHKEFKNKYVRQIFKIINKICEKHNFDLHEQNIMIRGNNQLVITDPVASN